MLLFCIKIGLFTVILDLLAIILCLNELKKQIFVLAELFHQVFRAALVVLPTVGLNQTVTWAQILCLWYFRTHFVTRCHAITLAMSTQIVYMSHISTSPSIISSRSTTAAAATILLLLRQNISTRIAPRHAVDILANKIIERLFPCDGRLGLHDLVTTSRSGSHSA